MKFSIRYHWRTEFILLEVIGKTVHSVIMCISSKTFNGHWPRLYNMIRPRGASVAIRFDREIFILGGYPNAEFYPV